MPADPPYRVGCHDIGNARDGSRITLAPMTADVARTLGPALAGIEPWARLGTSPALMRSFLGAVEAGAPRFQILAQGAVAGCVVVRHPWLHGPYLNLIGLLPPYQSRGIGERALSWFEAEARGHYRQVWLCVSHHNTGAQKFYAAHGYSVVATLDSLVKDGFDEILMRKRLA